MNAISSFRPFGESKEADENQNAAYKTWVDVFDDITLIGGSEKPSIKSLAEYAATTPGWSAIINADIRLDPRAKELPSKLDHMNANCAYSFRIPVGKFERADLGLDIFLATSRIWKRVAKDIPPEFCIGKIQWDTWLVSYFVNECKCVDFSPMKLVYHPTHGERGDQSVQVNQKDWYLNNVRMASRKIFR